MHNVQSMIYIQGNNLIESEIYTVKDEGASPLFAQKLGRHILAAPSFIWKSFALLLAAPQIRVLLSAILDHTINHLSKLLLIKIILNGLPPFHYSFNYKCLPSWNPSAYWGCTIFCLYGTINIVHHDWGDWITFSIFCTYVYIILE